MSDRIAKRAAIKLAGVQATTRARSPRAGRRGARRDSSCERSSLIVDEAIREVRQTRLAMLRSTIGLGHALLGRATGSSDPKAAARSLHHAQAEYELATRLLGANTLDASEAAPLRNDLAALRRELDHAHERSASTRR
jgi:hypothetical protein